MLKSISWQTYLVFMGWALAAWYLLIGIRYYSKDIRAQFLQRTNSSGRKERQAILGGDSSISRNGTTNEKPTMDPFTLAQQVRDEIKAILQESAERNSPKEETILALQICFRNYPTLLHTAFQVAINHFILEESEKLSSTHFEEADLGVLWIG